MSFFEKEGIRKKFYPVIHVLDVDQALRNASIALQAGADGMFLINHVKDSDHLLETYAQVRAMYPRTFVGINILTESPEDGLEMARDALDVSAFWTDDSGIGYDGGTIPERMSALNQNWPGYLFTSIAFKGMPQPDDLELATRQAAQSADVVVTSGQSTGSAPDVVKIAKMKAVIPDHPLAIASGMTPENIGPFLPHADVFMVATGISDSFTELNLGKATTMAELIHAR